MTREEILTITPEDKQSQQKINQIIAEFMGLCWHEWEPRTTRYKDEIVFHTGMALTQIVRPPTTAIYCKNCNMRFKGKYLRNAPKNPDYCQSLDLMWQVESQLDSLGIRGVPYVSILVHDSSYFQVLHMTALEKAKAAAITILEAKR